MTEFKRVASQDNLPLIDYAKKKYWANPSGNQQFQIRLARVSPILGFNNNFNYMGKFYLLPEVDRFFNVFTLGRINSGNYNLGYRALNWIPFNRWIRADEYINKRGVMLDFYNGKGLHYIRSETWIMQCFNGTTLVAFAKNDLNYPMPIDKPMYMHCYTVDGLIDSVKGYKDSEYKYDVFGCTYYEFQDWDTIKEKYNKYKDIGKGILIFYWNGLIVRFEDIKPEVGDLIECVYDPTVWQVLRFNYNTLRSYYSEKDSKRKLILFPWLDNKEKRYYYFDDCTFYVRNKRTNRAIYFHRNNQDAVRQLTHQDYGIAGEYVKSIIEYLITDDKTGLSKESDMEVVVNYIDSKWKFYLGPTSSRIAEMYLLEDPNKILDTMTDVKSNVEVWTANKLEQSSHNRLLGLEYTNITNKDVREALGYNGCSQVLSQGPFYMPGIAPGDEGFKNLYNTPNYLSGMGYEVPPSFIERSTVYEYDEQGLLLRKREIINQQRFTPSKDCTFVEYALGKGSSSLDAVLTKSDVKVDPDYGFRVYRVPWKIGDSGNEDDISKFWKSEWSISKDGQPLRQKNTFVSIPGNPDIPLQPDIPRPWDGGEIAGDWEDITDTDLYTLNKETGYLSWNFSMVNYVGMVVSDKDHLYNEVNVSHLDNSISFSLTHIWEIGGILLPIRPAQLDIWLEGQSLIENVDYKFDFPTVYIISKQLLKEGNSHNFKIRAIGMIPEGPLNRSELGFITNGCIGLNGRYNVRINRPTKTICNGRMFLTQSVDWAENKNHGSNMIELEGKPYAVKHTLCINRYVKPYETLWGMDEDKQLDEKISAYLTENVSYKNNTPKPIAYQGDKYILFSPFLSQLYNEMNLGFLPIKEDVITEQYVFELTKQIQWLLKYEPSDEKLNLDPLYFVVHPTANIGYQPITPKQLTVLTIANDLFLKGKVTIRGHFEVVTK